MYIFNFVVMYSRCSCNCAPLLTIFGTLLLRHKSYRYRDKLVFVPSALHLLLVNFTSEMSDKACACWPFLCFCVTLINNKTDVVFKEDFLRIK